MKWLLAAPVLACLSAAPALAGDETVVAEIGTATRITKGDLVKLAEAEGKYRALLDAGAVKQARRCLEERLALLVEEKLLLLECDAKEVPRLDDEGQDERARNRRRFALLFKREIDMSDVSISHEDAARYYDEHSADFDLPARTCAYVLETLDRSKADEVKAKLGKNREAWPAIAEKSDLKLRETPDSELESELGPRAFEIEKLTPGSATVIVTPSGYALVALVERRPARTRTCDEVEDAIKELLRDAIWRERVAKYVERVKSATPHWEKLPED